MGELFIGTDGGVLRMLENESVMLEEGGPSKIAFLARGHDAVFAVTRDGTLWARPVAGSWRMINERTVTDEIWSFAADPLLAGRLYLGVAPALLYRSDDGGVSWAACESVKRIPGYETWTFPPPPHIPHVRSIAPVPQAAGAVYIGVEEGGVYRSDDGGETWESLNEGLYWDVHTVAPAPDGVHLYATTGGGFYRSDDGGRHWRRMGAGLDHGYTVPCVVSPRHWDLIYTAAAAGPPPTWRTGANAAIYRSDDAGEHWTRLERGLPARFESMVQSIALDGENVIYAAAGTELYSSADGGDSWRLIAGNLPAIRSLLVV